MGGRIHTCTRTHECVHARSHSGTHGRDLNGCHSGLGPGLCPFRLAGKPRPELACTGSLLLPELIYSKDHLGAENNVLSYVNDRPY